MSYFIQEAYTGNFLDYNLLFSIDGNFTEVKTMLKKNFELLQAWFCETNMVLNPGKCHYLIINIDIVNESIELSKKTLRGEAEQKLLGIIIHKDLNIQSHKKLIIRTANQKLRPLYQSHTDFNRKILFNTLSKASSVHTLDV